MHAFRPTGRPLCSLSHIVATDYIIGTAQGTVRVLFDFLLYNMKTMIYDLAILGGGPAGVAAGVRAGVAAGAGTGPVAGSGGGFPDLPMLPRSNDRATKRLSVALVLGASSRLGRLGDALARSRLGSALARSRLGRLGAALARVQVVHQLPRRRAHGLASPCRVFLARSSPCDVECAT